MSSVRMLPTPVTGVRLADAATMFLRGVARLVGIQLQPDDFAASISPLLRRRAMRLCRDDVVTEVTRLEQQHGGTC
jgi:hypothetical protein